MYNYVEKNWGWEKWYENNDKYCLKELLINNGVWSSGGKFHFHRDKDETFFILEGVLILDVFSDDMIRRLYLHKGCSYRIKPNTPHRFSSFYDGKNHSCRFIEASTTHSDEDSYYCVWDEHLKDFIPTDPTR